MTPKKPSEKAKNPEQNLVPEEEIGYLHTEEGQKHIINIFEKNILERENNDKSQKIGYLQLILSILAGGFITLLVTYYSLQREFLQTKIEQQNERIKQLEQNQNPFLQLIR